MRKGWAIYSLYRDEYDGLWHIGFAYYTGRRDPSGFGWESKNEQEVEISDEELIKLLKRYVKQKQRKKK